MYGTFLDRTGRRINPMDVEIAHPFGGPVSCAVTSLGVQYVFFWSDLNGGHFGRIGADAKAHDVVGTPQIPALMGSRIATDGTHLLVVGLTQPGNAQMDAFLVNMGDGSLVREPVLIGGYGHADVRLIGDSFFVVSAESSGVRLRRFSVESTASAVPTVELSTNQALPGLSVPVSVRIASSGTETMVVWSETASSGASLWSSVVSSSGATAGKRWLGTFQHVGYYTDPALVWNGESYIASFGSSLVHLDHSGGLIQSAMDVGHAVSDIAVIDQILLAVGISYTSPGILKTTFSGGSELRTPTTDFLSITPADQSAPAAASDGIDFIAAFPEETAISRSFKAGRISRLGEVLDGGGLDVGASQTSSPSQGAIAFNGSIYVVVWADYGGVLARRFDTNGIPIDTAPISIQKYGRAPAIAWGQDAFLIVYETGGVDGNMLRPDGSLSPPIVIDAIAQRPTDPSLPLPHNFDHEPHVAWNGNQFLVVWGLLQLSNIEGPNFRLGTAASRLAADGTPLDRVPLLLESLNEQQSPLTGHATVASNGHGFLVAIDRDEDLLTIPVTPDGIVALPQTFFHWFDSESSSVGFDGTDYVISWLYSAIDTTWLGTARARADGQRAGASVIDVGKGDLLSAPAVTSNAMHETATMVSRFADGLPVRRVRAYFDREMQPMPGVPVPPFDVHASGGPSRFVVQWTNPPGAAGAVVDLFKNGAVYTESVVQAGQQSAIFSNVTSPIQAIRVRIFNAGGVSDPVTIMISSPRVRATR